MSLNFEKLDKVLTVKENKALLLTSLASLPFWCYGKGDAQNCCLTHRVGLPRHPATKQPMPLTPYQVEFFEEVVNHKKPKHGQSTVDALRDPHFFHLNKGRQMGFTEIVLRVIQYFCLHDYAGSKVGIIAATNGSLAKKDLRRFVRLFSNVRELMQSYSGNIVKLANGTSIEAFPASEESMTGDTNYKCIFMDEAAKWRVTDDTPIFNSITPIVNTNGADLFLVSTPKGPIKMFYEIHKNPKEYKKLEYDIWRAEGNLYTKKQIEIMIATAQEDPNQEYLCKFTYGKNAVFGEITPDMYDAVELEWEREEEAGISHVEGGELWK